MKNKLKYIIIGIVAITIIVSSILVIFNIVSDDNKLTVDEKKWINANLSTLQNVNTVNNINIFGDNGYGVFYDFINDFSKEYQIKVNPVTYNFSETNVDDGFKMVNKIDNNSVVFYDDYYVLVGKNYENIKSINDLTEKIGVLSNNNSYINSYINSGNLVNYNTYAELNSAFESSEQIKYMLVPKTLYLGYTIKNNYSFIYHLSDLKTYFIYEMKNDDVFSMVIKKYYNIWKNENLSKSICSNLLNTLTYNLGINEADFSNIKAKEYRYGFVNNSPYEVLISGNFGGIVSEYLKNFSDLTGVEFKFTRYKNYNAFANAIKNNEVDLYFNYYTSDYGFRTINTGLKVNYVIIAKNNNPVVVNSLASLQNTSVYVLEDSLLFSHLTNVPNVNIKTYKNTDDLKKLVKDDNIIMLDKETYEYMANNELDGYNIRYENTTNSTYDFKVNSEDNFYKLFSKYIMVQDAKYIKLRGIYNHSIAVSKGSFFGKIAKYILIILIAISLLLYIWYRSAKRVKLSKKIKKEDKIKFIDQLTSLKNRNYLHENIDAWNKNNIYPQTTIVVDLNKVQDINDTKGYDEGDKQIKAASNILIRTQLDNSDIMRTDGNEFLIYTVGYDKRSIESYIRKLIREFKNLPYDYGAIISFSMIENDLKTVEDAINEAVDDMKEKKSGI